MVEVKSLMPALYPGLLARVNQIIWNLASVLLCALSALRPPEQGDGGLKFAPWQEPNRIRYDLTVIANSPATRVYYFLLG